MTPSSIEWPSSILSLKDIHVALVTQTTKSLSANKLHKTTPPTLSLSLSQGNLHNFYPTLIWILSFSQWLQKQDQPHHPHLQSWRFCKTSTETDTHIFEHCPNLHNLRQQPSFYQHSSDMDWRKKCSQVPQSLQTSIKLFPLDIRNNNVSLCIIIVLKRHNFSALLLPTLDCVRL